MFGPISRFVNEGISQDSLVVYIYKGDAERIKEGLAHHGLNIRESVMKRSLRFVPFSSLYQGEGVLDEEAALAYCVGLVNEVRAIGKNDLRMIIDYEDQAERPFSKFINHLTDSRWTTPDHYVSILFAFSEDAFQGQEPALNLLKSKISTTELSDVIDIFSK